MMLNIFHTHISDVRNVAKSNLSLFFTEKKPKLYGHGHGIVTVLNADEQRVSNMALLTETNAMLDYVRGGVKILQLREQMISVGVSSINMDYRNNRLKKCVLYKMGNVLSANTARLAYLWIIAIRLIAFVRFYARPAIPFLAGMKKKRIRFCGSSDTLRHIRGNNRPCHADVLLEIVNGEKL